jgi:hypothetical protein
MAKHEPHAIAPIVRHYALAYDKYGAALASVGYNVIPSTPTEFNTLHDAVDFFVHVGIPLVPRIKAFVHKACHVDLIFAGTGSGSSTTPST